MIVFCRYSIAAASPAGYGPYTVNFLFQSAHIITSLIPVIFILSLFTTIIAIV